MWSSGQTSSISATSGIFQLSVWVQRLPEERKKTSQWHSSMTSNLPSVFSYVRWTVDIRSGMVLLTLARSYSDPGSYLFSLQRVRSITFLLRLSVKTSTLPSPETAGIGQEVSHQSPPPSQVCSSNQTKMENDEKAQKALWGKRPETSVFQVEHFNRNSKER